MEREFKVEVEEVEEIAEKIEKTWKAQVGWNGEVEEEEDGSRKVKEEEWKEGNDPLSR